MTFMSSAFKSQHWYQLQSIWRGNGMQVSASFPSLLSSQRLAAHPIIPVPMWPQLSHSRITSLRPSCSTAQPLQDPRNNYQIPWCVCSTAARTDSYHVSHTTTPQHNIPQCPLGTGYRWRSHHQSWPRRKSPLQGWPLHIDRTDHSCACWWLSVQGTDPGVQP